MKNLCYLFPRWLALCVIGFCGGIVLESIHNSILISTDWGNTPLPLCSKIVIHTFRSSYRARLTTGWGSALTPLFTILNLLVFGYCCFISLKGRSRFSIHRRVSSVLNSCLILNLLLFFMLLACLVVPLIKAKGIMGASDDETVCGATALGNLICLVESWFPFILIGIIIMLSIGCLLKKKGVLRK
jgi:hypothetical protein